MGLKYEFTDNKTLNVEGSTIHQIRRLSDSKLGGWIESEDNLSQEGSCFIYNDAKVYGNARVYNHGVVEGNAQVYGNAQVFDEATAHGNAKVYDNAKVYGNAADIYGDAQVYGNAKVYDHAWVNDKAQVYGNAKVYDHAWVNDNARVYDDAIVNGHALVYGNAQIYDSAKVYDRAKIYDNAEVCGNAIVCGTAKVYGDIKITSGKYTHGEFSCEEDLLKYNESKNNETKNNETKKVIQDFIYKVDDSNKLKVKTEYSSIDEYFNSSYQNDIKLDTLIIGTVDTKIPLIKLEKIEKDEQLKYKFIVDLTTENEDHFLIQSFIETKEQLSQKLTQTIDALNQYPEFNKYTDDLSNCVCD